MIVIIAKANKEKIIRNEVELWIFHQDNRGDCVLCRCLVLLLYLAHQETVVVVIVLQWAGGSECRPLMGRYPSEDKC